MRQEDQRRAAAGVHSFSARSAGCLSAAQRWRSSGCSDSLYAPAAMLVNWNFRVSAQATRSVRAEGVAPQIVRERLVSRFKLSPLEVVDDRHFAHGTRRRLRRENGSEGGESRGIARRTRASSSARESCTPIQARSGVRPKRGLLKRFSRTGSQLQPSFSSDAKDRLARWEGGRLTNAKNDRLRIRLRIGRGALTVASVEQETSVRTGGGVRQ